MKGLGRRLRNGTLSIEPDSELIRIISDTEEDIIKYSELKGSDWGYVYERHVAQHLVDKGYSVSEHGLAKGFGDGGIDLIAEHSEKTAYIQCKYTTSSKLGRQKIEWILYKASSYLAKTYRGNQLEFWLVIPSFEAAFSSIKSPLGRHIYPMADYFLSHNNTQSKVRLAIKEIAMNR